MKTGGYAVYQDDLFASSPMFNPQGEFLDYSPRTVGAIMHGDNADEGNIFREDSRSPGKLDELSQAASEIRGEESARGLLKLYGLDEASLGTLGKKEVAQRIHRFPEDARFYLLSDRLRTVWPGAAVYHLTAKSPFKASRFPDDSYHELDNLYVCPPYAYSNAN